MPGSFEGLERDEKSKQQRADVACAPAIHHARVVPLHTQCTATNNNDKKSYSHAPLLCYLTPDSLIK